MVSVSDSWLREGHKPSVVMLIDQVVAAFLTLHDAAAIASWLNGKACASVIDQSYTAHQLHYRMTPMMAC